jgi:hypothetical protein
MDRVGIYKHQAQLCRNLASRERDPKHRADLMQLAERWSSLATGLEQMITARGEAFRRRQGDTSQ